MNMKNNGHVQQSKVMLGTYEGLTRNNQSKEKTTVAHHSRLIHPNHRAGFQGANSTEPENIPATQERKPLVGGSTTMREVWTISIHEYTHQFSAIVSIILLGLNSTHNNKCPV